MIDEIGRDELDELERLSKSTNKLPTTQLTDMIDDYTKKVKEMS